MRVTHHDAQVECGPDYIRIAMTGDYGSAKQARRLIDKVADAGNIYPIDRGFARLMIQDWDEYREHDDRLTINGTRISVNRL